MLPPVFCMMILYNIFKFIATYIDKKIDVSRETSIALWQQYFYFQKIPLILLAHFCIFFHFLDLPKGFSYSIQIDLIAYVIYLISLAKSFFFLIEDVLYKSFRLFYVEIIANDSVGNFYSVLFIPEF